MADNVSMTEILSPFQTITAIENGDMVLLQAVSDGVFQPARITAALLRAYLIAGITELSPKIALHTLTSGAWTGSIHPGVMNMWDGAPTALTLTLASGLAGYANEYMMQFTCPAAAGTQLTLPSSVRWVNNEPLEPEPGMTYQISIVDNLAVYAGWEAAAS